MTYSITVQQKLTCDVTRNQWFFWLTTIIQEPNINSKYNIIKLKFYVPFVIIANMIIESFANGSTDFVDIVDRAQKTTLTFVSIA